MKQKSNFRVIDGKQQNEKSDWFFFLKDRTQIIEYLDNLYPEMGVDNACFAVYVVMFSALALNTANTFALQRFTRYRMEFIEAVISNLRANGLVQGERYDPSAWLEAGRIHDRRLWEEMEAACGNMYFPYSKGKPTIFIDQIEHEPRPRFRGNCS